MVFWRLKCHACGTRSPYSKGSETTRFRCAQCQTWNFVDSNGDYIDPPANFILQQAAEQRFDNLNARPSPSAQQNIFCQTCLRNQQIYHELLSNYLPDEDDPRYAKYERALPDYKRDLESRYPQICKECAPKAQSIIHEADYYSMTNNASRMMEQSRGGRRSMSPAPVTTRDTGTKMVVRLALTLVSWAVFLSAAYQILWHALSIIELRQDWASGGRLLELDHEPWLLTPLQPPPRASQCLEEISRLHFSRSCCIQIGKLIPRLLLVSACLLWYNHGLKKLYSPDIRIASITGWRQHLSISTMTLALRWFVYTLLTNRQRIIPDLTLHQELAVHMVSIVFIVGAHSLAKHCINTEKWRVTGSIMPRPEDRDILSQFAGPASQKHVALASSTAPSALLSKENVTPFPIQNLAGQRQGRTTTTYTTQDLDDPMDIEPVAPAQALSSNGFQSSSFGRSTGWDSVRTNLFSIEDETRARQEQRRQGSDDDKHMYFKPTQPTPFRGRLPQPPMSQERRLRNPVTQVPRFKEIPVTQRQDFLQQMRNGIDKGRGFMMRGRSEDSGDSDITTHAASRTRGQLELASSDWHLKQDVNAATGLEDLFSGTFNINDQTERQTDQASMNRASRSPQQLYVAGVAALVVVSILFVLDIAGFRRGVCLYFVRRLDELGY